MDAKTIADKYITSDGRAPRPSKEVVWAPVAILEKERNWLTKAVLRGGLMPYRERDGEGAPHLSELRSMHQRGLVSGLPWRITKLGRECLRELEAKPIPPSPVARPLNKPPAAPPLATINTAHQQPIRRLADVEREAIQAAIEQCDGNKSRAARALGISVRTIRNKTNHYREQTLNGQHSH